MRTEARLAGDGEKGKKMYTMTTSNFHNRKVISRHRTEAAAIKAAQTYDARHSVECECSGSVIFDDSTTDTREVQEFDSRNVRRNYVIHGGADPTGADA